MKPQMNETVRFIDQSRCQARRNGSLGTAIVIPKETIDAEVERLASLPRPANGRRRSLIAHPRAGNGRQRPRRRHSGRARCAASRASGPFRTARIRRR